MVISEFFDLVLPDAGLRCIAIPCANPADGFRHSFKDTNAASASFAADADRRGVNVYFGCASYLDKKGGRKGVNAAAARSFWLDLDVGEDKPYATQGQAAQALVGFVRALGLPAPLIVSSGKGLHVYWPMTADLDPVTWKLTATYLKACCKLFGLKADPSRTSDIASVLRPVGTTHRKAGPIPVSVVRLAGQSDHGAFSAAVMSYIGTNGAALPGPQGRAVAAFADNADLAGGITYAAAYSDRVADQCGVVGLVRDKKGCVDQPTWFHTLQVLAFCDDGEEAAHEWSSGDPRYTHRETQAAFERVKAFKPTTCEKLADHQLDICAVCPHWGKIKSPIGLGTRPAPVVVMVDNPAASKSTAFGSDDDDATPAQVQLGFPHGYSLLQLTAPFPQLCYSTKDDAGTLEWHPFCNTSFYPINRLGDTDSGFSNEFEMIVKAGETRRFVIPTSTINEGGSGLASILGRYEIAALPNMKPKVEHYLQSWMGHLRENRDAITPRQFYGWHEDEFLIGDTLIAPTGTRTAIVTGIAADKVRELTPKGDLDTWKHVIDTAYNYEGQEALQFCVMLSFAAPIFSMLKQYGGITAYAHSEGSGVGKTTAQRAGLSAWGNWEGLQMADGKATANALWGMIGAYHNLPVLFDELTNQSNKEASELVFSVSSGRQKERMTSDGRRNKNNSNWSTILMASGNNMLSEKLGQHRANAGAEIARLFEFTVRSKSRLSPNEAADLFPKLGENYGHAGMVFATHLVENKAEIMELLLRVQAGFNTRARCTQSERYWAALAASVLTALIVARRLDLIQFPLEGLTAWLITQVASNRGGIVDAVAQPTDMFGKMFADLWAGVLVTWGEGDLRKKNPATIISRNLRGQMVGRAIVAQDDTETTILRINAGSVRDWCNKRGVSAREMFTAGVRAGWISPSPERYSLGKGTNEYANIPTSVMCWVIDPVKMGLDVGVGPATQSIVQDGET